MQIFTEIKTVKEAIKQYKIKGKTIGLVPTMGAVHQGHLSLIEETKKHSDIVVVTIFVNKKQFNNMRDYQKYPKTLGSDVKKLQKANSDILFMPNEREIYPDNFLISIEIDKLTKQLCGTTRPGHLEGAALIMVKLYNIINPDIAVFGEKDFQQLQVMRQLVKDLNFDVKIIGGKLIREESGLALSSRNLRLSENDKKIAPKIYQILLKIKQKLLQEPLEKPNIESILNDAKNELINANFGKIDYLEIRDEENLQLVTKFKKEVKSRIFIAVYLGDIRLIDNLVLY